MNIIDKAELKFDSQMKELSEKEQKVFTTIKNVMLGGYNLIKPVLIAVFMFWLFARIRKSAGEENIVFILLVTIIVFLRHISSKLS